MLIFVPNVVLLQVKEFTSHKDDHDKAYPMSGFIVDTPKNVICEFSGKT